MITKATKEFPEINWERLERNDSVDHTVEYGAIGYGATGGVYSATWQETAGTVDIIDIVYEGIDYDFLIAKHIQPLLASEWGRASIEHAIKALKPSGTFLTAIRSMIDEAVKIENQQL